jgi:hypothetical protein
MAQRAREADVGGRRPSSGQHTDRQIERQPSVLRCGPAPDHLDVFGIAPGTRFGALITLSISVSTCLLTQTYGTTRVELYLSLYQRVC